MKVEFNKKEQNPFFGLKSVLKLFQSGSKGELTESMLDTAYAEVNTLGDYQKEYKELFWVLLFNIGDITARQHNIFGKKKVDNGGNSAREAFFVAMEWMKRKHYKQFVSFMNAGLFNEFVNFDNLLRSRVKTDGKQKAVKVYDVFTNKQYCEDLANYLVTVINGSNPFNKAMIAKFLTIPRLGKRAKAKKMLDETKSVMRNRAEFLKILSSKMGWSYQSENGVLHFSGYREWRKQYMGELESVLFSTGRILEFDRQEFQIWLQKLPSQARFRVRNRIMFEKDGEFKYPNLKIWYEEWKVLKEKAQHEQRVLEEKVRQGDASDTDKLRLAEVKKEARVNTGAVNFADIFAEIVIGSVDKLKVQPFLDKINLPYNNLVFIDDSGSMTSRCGAYPYSAFEMATFIATISLMKNPDDDGRSLLGLFSNGTRMFNGITSRTTRQNHLLVGQTTQVSEPLIDPEKHFLDNLKRLKEFTRSQGTYNGTNIASIPVDLAKACNNDPTLLEQLMNFPIWTIISDGNWNNLYSPESSLNEMLRKAENLLGFKPFIIAIDVASNSNSATIERFSGIDNFMYLPPNPAQIEMFLTNFKDIEVFDIYTPLQSLFRSNRYDLIKSFIL